jgi:hypothetical protein
MSLQNRGSIDFLVFRYERPQNAQVDVRDFVKAQKRLAADTQSISGVARWHPGSTSAALESRYLGLSPA